MLPPLPPLLYYRLLLCQGASPWVCTGEGETLMDLVEEEDRHSMAAILQGEGAGEGAGAGAGVGAGAEPGAGRSRDRSRKERC